MFDKISGVDIIYGKMGGEEGGIIKIFRQNFFVSVPKNFVGELFSVSLFLGIEKFYA